ncbi:hypothetical protein [Paraburkholderia bannensis]|uniref:hypothetical protein n=1 Tax=Paraburkholderia bannensis TaxID=765414 RepID=UPI002AC311E9|nr:hypothetical protein [Paraburkholderia bannensis]
MRQDERQEDRGVPLLNEAWAVAASIRTIRQAQGKRMLEDCSPESPEYLEVLEEFARDLCNVLGFPINATS